MCMYGDFEYRIERNGTVTITKYGGQSQHITIPKKIEGRAVGHLADNLLGNSPVEEVVIPGNVTQIWGSAFQGSSKLKKVVIEEGVLSIGVSVFKGCPNLEEVVIPDSVTKISFAFDKTPKVRVVANPGSYAEEYCRKQGIRLASDGHHIVEENHTVCALFDDGTAELIAYTGTEENVVIPQTCQGHRIVKICKKAIQEHWMVRISSGVQQLDDYALYNCRFVVVPDTIVTMAPKCFKGINRVVFTPKGSPAEKHCQDTRCIFTRPGKAYHYVDDCLYVLYEDGTAQLVSYWGKHEQLVIPQTCADHTVTSILNKAIYQQANLKKIRIPESVAQIGEDNFYQCGETITKVPNPNYERFSELQNDPWARKEYGLYDPIEPYFDKYSYHVEVIRY